MKRCLMVFLVIAVICSSSFSSYASTVVDKASALYNLGLLKGTGAYFSQQSLELNRNATRAEVCTTIVRMLGKEAKADYQQNSHPFGDVPYWASNYVGWLYENYLVNGMSDTYFGANDIATVQQFSTMLLRVLGFDDKKWDFSYDTAVAFAQSYGLVSRKTASHYELSREDMIDMCYNALTLNIKNSNRKLIKKLCDEKAVDETVARNIGLLKAPSISDSFADVPETLGAISVSRSGTVFRIKFNKSVEEYGLRVFVCPEGGLVKEVDINNIEKGKITYPGGGAAGYVNELYVYDLDWRTKYSFIVIKTSSEGELYQTLAKSGVANN